MNLPVYELQIDQDRESDLSVKFIALVDKPAVERNFLAFKDQPKRQCFATVDDDRQIISGLAMAADELIYRKDDTYGEYNVFFKPATIYNVAQKFFALGYNNNFNIMHDPKLQCNGVTVFESFICDPARGINPMTGFEDVKPGSWFISAKVDNPDVWKAVKEGLVKGFSIEGMFSYSKEEIAPAEEQLLNENELSEYEQILQILK